MQAPKKDKTIDHNQVQDRPGQGDCGYFAGHTAIPLLGEEIIQACRHLPIGFMYDEECWSPVAITGLRQGENLLVDSSGSWLADYLPVRIQACLLAPAFGTEQEKMQADTGGQLFEKITQARKNTGLILELWSRLKIIVPWKINVRNNALSKKISMEGIFQVSGERIKDLDDESFMELRQQGALEMIWAHWISRSLLIDLASKLPFSSGALKNRILLDLDRGTLSREEKVVEFC